MPSELHDALMHYGVPGMKWGKRKQQTSSSSSRSEDRAATDSIRKQRVRSLSNSQLKKANERLQLERTYADLTRSQTKINKGHNKVKAILAIAGTATAAYNTINSPAGKAAIKKARELMGR